MTDRPDHPEALRLADDYVDWADLPTESEKLEYLIDGFGIGSVRPDAAGWLRTLLAEVSELRAQVDKLVLAEEGAAQAFGDVVQDKRDLEAEVKRMQSLLDGAYASIRKYAKTVGA